MARGCCSTNETTLDAPSSLSGAARAARAVAGLGFLALAWGTPWPIAIVAAWFGVAHLVASATSYVGCPELGAIPSLLLDRRLRTHCGPWQAVDRWLARRRPGPRPAG